MSANDLFERRLPAILDSIAPMRAPEYFDDILGQVDRTRQRPGWTFPERWIPVSAITNRLAVAPRVPMRLAIAVILLILVAVVGTLLLAGGRQRVPLPFGPAANGLLVYADDGGAIVSADLDGGAPKTIVPGPGNEHPVFSPDGTQLAYVYREAGNKLWIRVAAADGSSPRTIHDDPLMAVGYLGWSPDARTIVAARQPTVRAVDAVNGGPPSMMLLDIQGTEYSDGSLLTGLFRPPSGQEVLYLGRSGKEGFGLYRRTIPDGKPVPLLTDAHQTVPFGDLGNPAWSPDGTQIALQVLAPGADGEWRIYVMDADGSNPRRLTLFDLPGTLVSEGNPAWSPDGKQIAIQQWFDDEAEGVDSRPITVVDVADGDEHEVGPASIDGFVGWAWSPDGTSILEVPNEPSPYAGRVLVVDAVTGEVTETDLTAASAASWQRTAP
jgi:dipeptidyl aminopeptidase/acylaminoacyl peptidase